MDTAIIVLGQMVALFFVIIMGYIMARVKLVNDSFIKGVGAYLSKAAIPVSLVLSLQQEFSFQRLRDLGAVTAGMTIATLCGVLPCLLLCRLRKVPLRESGVWMSCAAFSNCIFMGQPILIELYHDDAVFPISAIMFTFNALCFTLGTYMISMGAEQERPTPKAVAKKVLLNNCIISAGVGLIFFLFSIRIPTPIAAGMKMVSNTMSPLAMLIVGYALAQLRVVELFNDLRMYLVSAVKLLVCPILTFLIVRTFITNPVLLGALCICAAMPTASTIGVLCEEYGNNNTTLCAKIMFGSTLLSAVTTPLCMLIMGNAIR